MRRGKHEGLRRSPSPVRSALHARWFRSTKAGYNLLHSRYASDCACAEVTRGLLHVLAHARIRQGRSYRSMSSATCQRRPDIGPLRRPDDRLAGSGRWRSDVLSIHRLRKIFYRLLDRITALNIIMKAAQRLYAGEQVQLPAGNRNDTWRPGQHPRLGLLRGGRWWFTCCNVDSYQ